MTTCCVLTCANGRKSRDPRKDISFHMFPRDLQYRNLWLQALELPTNLVKKSVVCSDHFVEADFHLTKTGLRRLNTYAIPNAKLKTPDPPRPLQVCKICLAMDVKMYSLKDSKLHNMYENLTGIIVRERTDLPQHVCWECTARLTAAATFKNKAVLTDRLLNDVLKETPRLELQHIININQKYALKSNLAMQRLMDIDELINSQSFIKSEIAVTQTDENFTQTDETDPIVTHNDDTSMNVIHNGLDMKAIQNDEQEIELKDIVYEPVLVKDETGRLIERIDVFASNDVKTEVDLIPEYSVYENDYPDEDVEDKQEMEVDTVRTVGTSPLDSVYMDEEIEEVKNVKEDESKKVKRGAAPMNRSKQSKQRYAKPRRPLDEDKFTVTKLTHKQQIEEIQRRAESPRFKAAAYKCMMCFKFFLNQEMYNRHALKHSEQSGAHECPICKYRYKTRRAWRSHLRQQHSEEYSCNECPFVSRTRWPAFNHIQYHAGTTYKCKHCSDVFSQQTTYLNHLRLKHMSSFVCGLCGYTFVSARGVIKHQLLKHPLLDANVAMEGPYCKICNVQFLNKIAYEKHLMLSSKHISEDDPNRLSNDPSIKTRRLQRAARPAVRRTAIRRGQLRHQPDTPVTCEQCGEVLPNLLKYVWHFRREHPGLNRTKFRTKNTPYMCEQCGKIFLNYTLLSNHMWVHTGSKPYQCDHCNKTFSLKANLALHMQVHDVRRRKYECHVCGKMFAFTFNRTRHMFLHTGLKPFKCDACEKCFVTSGELRAHVDHVHLKKPRPKRVRRKVKKNDMLSVES